MTKCGVVLHSDALKIVALRPYLREGAAGPFIYCRSTKEQGPFLDMKIDPSDTDGSVNCVMTISVPLHLVVMIATPEDDSWIGFVDSSN